MFATVSPGVIGQCDVVRGHHARVDPVDCRLIGVEAGQCADLAIDDADDCHRHRLPRLRVDQFDRIGANVLSSTETPLNWKPSPFPPKSRYRQREDIDHRDVRLRQQRLDVALSLS